MLQPVIDLEYILKKEIDLYDQVFYLEQEKSDAIMSRNGKKLDGLAHQQETLLSEVTFLEEKRDHVINEYVTLNKLDDCGKAITLRDIVHSMDEDSSRHLMRLGMDLKSLLLKLNELQMNNHVMISDNMEFYNILVSGLKGGNTFIAGYGSDGRENNSGPQSVLFNKTV